MADQYPLIITPVGKLTSVFLAEPSWNINQTAKNYSTNIIFDENTPLIDCNPATPESERLPLADIVENILREKHPKGVPGHARRPFRSGAEKPEKEEYNDTDTFLVCKRKESFGPPPLVGATKQALNASAFYPGCYARLAIRPFYYGADKGGVPGVSFGLECVQFAADGERIESSATPVDPMECFDAIPVDVADLF